MTRQSLQHEMCTWEMQMGASHASVSDYIGFALVLRVQSHIACVAN